MRRFLLLFLILTFLAGYRLSHAGTVPTAHQPSTGTPVYVDGKTFVQYFPAGRVMADDLGRLAVCPGAGTHIDWHLRSCLKADETSGWVYLSGYSQVGYTLQFVQVNETSSGPSLVLYWYPTAEVLAADKKKHD